VARSRGLCSARITNDALTMDLRQNWTFLTALEAQALTNYRGVERAMNCWRRLFRADGASRSSRHIPKTGHG
jgi:hypothetical protein